jgi:dTDP-4-dehydrorhamnose reductase
VAVLERILLLGGRGQLGTEFRTVFADHALIAPSHEDVDVTDFDSVLAALERHKPSLLINATAYHHVERCESFPERAFAVNAHAVDRLAAACALAGIAFATFSTDYVFDGTSTAPYHESDRPNPLNAYGASKLAGEQLTRRHGSAHFIIRTSGLYGQKPSSVKGYTFVDRILEQARKGEKLRVVDDLVFSPSFAADVAAGFRRVVETGVFGTYHITNSGETSWFAFANEALAQAGLESKIEAISSAEHRGVNRPPYSPLAHAAMDSLGLATMPSWQDGLRAYFRLRSAQ